MKRLLYAGLLLGLLWSGSGCAMCANPWDYAYGTYGGKWQRGDQFHGRVNSAFDPAGGDMHSEETLSDAPQPPAMGIDEAELEPTAEMLEP